MTTFFKSDRDFYLKLSQFFDKKRFNLRLSIKKMAERCGLIEANLSHTYLYQQGLDSFKTLSKLCKGHGERVIIVINQLDYERHAKLTYKWQEKNGVDTQFQAELGKVMLDARNTKGISQRTLGTLTGSIHRERNIWKIEKGEVLAEIQNLEFYCKVLKLQLVIVIEY